MSAACIHSRGVFMHLTTANNSIFSSGYKILNFQVQDRFNFFGCSSPNAHSDASLSLISGHVHFRINFENTKIYII